MDNMMRKKFESEKAKLLQAKQKGLVKSASGGGNVGSATRATTIGSATATTTVTTAQSSAVTSPLTGSSNNPGAFGGSSFGASLSPFAQQQPQPTRIVSEAERRLEEQIRNEAAKSFEEEKTKLEKLYEAKLVALKKVLDKDMADAKAADAARRAEGNAGFNEERERRIEECRTRCDAKYGTQLRELERQVESLQTQVQKATEEKSRMEAQMGGGKAAIEKEAAAESERELTKMHNEMAEKKRKQLNLATAGFNTHKTALEASITGAMAKARAEMDADYRRKEVSLAMAVEAKRKKLETAKRDLELDIRNARKTAPTSGASGSPSSSKPTDNQPAQGRSADATSTEATIAAIEAKRDATCLTIRSQSTKELATLRQTKEAEIAALKKAITAEKEKQGKLAKAATPQSPASTPATTHAMTFAQRMAALRARFAKEKLETMNRLTKEREARIAEAKGSAVSTPLSTNRSPIEGSVFGISNGPDSLAELSSEDVAIIADRAAYYKKVQADWSDAMAKHVQMAVANPQDVDATIEAVADTDLLAFTKKITIRREKERAALEEKKAKMLADHAAALQAYEEKKASAEARREEEIQETKAAMMEDAVREAVEKEMAALRRNSEAAMSRRLDGYKREEEALKEGIEEEMQAYLQAETQRLDKEDQVAAETVQAARPSTEALAALSTLNEETSRLSAQWESIKARKERVMEQQKASFSLAKGRLHAKLEQQRQLERAASRAMTSMPPTTVAAATPPPASPPPQAPAKKTVVKLVPPPDSVAKATHAARMAALEEGYKDQEAALRKELAEVTAKVRSAAALQPQQQQQHLESPTTAQTCTTSQATPLGNTVGGFSVASRAYGTIPSTFNANDALRLWRSQEEEQRLRLSARLAARDEWRRESSMQSAVVEAPTAAQPQQQTRRGSNGYSGGVSVSPSPEPRRLVAAVETLNRTLDALSGRVAQLETSTSRGSHSRESRLGEGASRLAPPRGHPSGLPSSPLRVEKTTVAEDDLRRKWERSLRNYRDY